MTDWIIHKCNAPRPKGRVKVQFSGETRERAEMTEYDLACHYRPTAWLGNKLPRIIAYKPEHTGSGPWSANR